HRDIAEVWKSSGNVKETEGAYRRVLATHEKLARAFPQVSRYRKQLFDGQGNLGDLLWHAGRRAEAKAAYRQAAEFATAMDLRDPDSRYVWAWFLAPCPAPQFRDPPRAVALAKKVTERQPNDDSYWTTLGVAYYRAGDWQAAIEALSKAAAMSDGCYSHN